MTHDLKWLVNEALKVMSINDLCTALDVDRGTVWKWRTKDAPMQITAFCKLLEIVNNKPQ